MHMWRSKDNLSFTLQVPEIEASLSAEPTSSVDSSEIVFKKDLFLFLGMSVWVCAIHAQMDLQARRESQMSWSYNYKWLELSDTGSGPLEEQ